MKQKYTDLFVDFDDTIYDTRGNAEIALKELFEKKGLDRHFGALEEFTQPYWEANVELWEKYSRGEITRDYLIVERFRRPLSRGVGLEPSREYCLEVSDCFLELCAEKSGIVAGARELLDYLSSKYRLHLCSNGFREVQFKKLRASDTLRYFRTVILSEDVGANKPSKAFFDYAMRVTGVDPKATLMIGDNYQTDIVGANNAGLDTLLFDRWGIGCEGVFTYRVDYLTDIMAIL